MRIREIAAVVTVGLGAAEAAGGAGAAGAAGSLGSGTRGSSRGGAGTGKGPFRCARTSDFPASRKRPEDSWLGRETGRRRDNA